ncbi:hypothetical protein NEMIN01_1966 [Nematocida minor]|uniref:uncharacterized protein n=1 Tax=Nematocida minor TaxID=1912983 RepID=UPI00221E73F8|nr:uncharacterized protein NEMIN01_1966 [Nematocida minor]KAI5192352.1 hypothetical protein NEMIN01_1966 [Nematocida minor]
MGYESLGSTVRHALLKYAVLERISIWEFSEWDAVWMTALSSTRMILTVIISTVIAVVCLALIILRKREFTQKDTLCAFVFMVVSIFLLESVQKMLKIDVALDTRYKNVEISIPFSPLIVNTPVNRQRLCRNDLNDTLEKTTDQMNMGDRAAEAYRKLVRENTLKKRPPIDTSMVSPSFVNGSSNMGSVSMGGGSALQPMKTEYCIFKNNQNENQKNCTNCLVLEENEFNEAKADLQYIDKVNREYQDIERSIDVSKNQYREYSVDLMNGFKNFNKVSYFAREELSTIGVDFNTIEQGILSLVNKYESIFAGTSRKTTQLRMANDSVCVSISNVRVVVPEMFKVKTRRIKKTIVTEKEGNHPARGLVITSGAVESLEDSSSDRFDKRALSVDDAVHEMVKSNANLPNNIIAQNGSYSSGYNSGNPFFNSLNYALITTEVLIFIQVFLVLGVIIAIVLDRKWLYFVFYTGMCVSLIFSLILGFIALVNSTALASICANGLKCESQMFQAQENVKTLSGIIDMPEMVLKESIKRSTDHLQRQINIVLTSNTAEDIQTISAQLDRLFQVRKDFNNLVSTNPHRNMINQSAIYAAADSMNSSLNNIKSLDRKIRSNQWTDTFKKLSQISVLLTATTNNSNIKRRQTLSQLSNGVSPTDVSSCEGKEASICKLKERSDSLFIGLCLFAILLPILIAI